jgi:hypothetical protein
MRQFWTQDLSSRFGCLPARTSLLWRYTHLVAHTLIGITCLALQWHRKTNTNEDPQATSNPLELPFHDILWGIGTRTPHKSSIGAKDKNHPPLNDHCCSKHDTLVVIMTTWLEDSCKLRMRIIHEIVEPELKNDTVMDSKVFKFFDIWSWV